MRAMICMKFSAYTFENVDSLSFSRVREIYASCQWLQELENAEVQQASKKAHR